MDFIHKTLCQQFGTLAHSSLLKIMQQLNQFIFMGANFWRALLLMMVAFTLTFFPSGGAKVTIYYILSW